MFSCLLLLQKPAPKEIEEVVEAKVGDVVEAFMGRGHVRAVRQDGMLEVWALGWEMAGEQRPRFYMNRDSVKVVPTVYYKMQGERKMKSPVAVAVTAVTDCD